MGRKKWYRYTVDGQGSPGGFGYLGAFGGLKSMLEYDCGYMDSKPEVDEELSEFYGYTAYKTQPTEVFSAYEPTVRRWASMGMRVTDIQRVDRPEREMWTVTKPPYFGADYEWRLEQPK